MQVTNTNYRVHLDISGITLSSLYLAIPNSKLYVKRPKMIRVRMENITILIFNNFSARVMGKGSNHEAILAKLCESIPCSYSHFTLQSHTIIYQLPFKVNLHKLTSTPFLDMRELYPCIRYTSCPGNINIFSSGKLVHTGARDVSTAHFHRIQVLIMLACAHFY